MPNDDEAYRAIVETDETVFMGNELQVKKSRPQATAAPKPEKPVKPKRPHHPYIPPTQESQAWFEFFFAPKDLHIEKKTYLCSVKDGLVAQLDRATAF